MPLIPCRGHEKRIWLCREYEITPVAHLKLLVGQTLESCAGGKITDSYFRFHAVRKGNPNDHGDIICGYPTGCDFCDILGVAKTPLFNPLKAKGSGGGAGGSGGPGTLGTPINPVMQQLYDAVMILLTYLPYREESPLANIQETISKYPAVTPFNKYVKAVNKILESYDLTMPMVIECIRKENGPVRNFKFDLLAGIVVSLGMDQRFV